MIRAILLSILFFTFLDAKILHLSFHRGCINNFKIIAEKIALDVESLFIQDLPQKQLDGITEKGNALYNIGHERAERIWNLHKDYFNQFDAVIVSDTAPLARIFLQNNFAKPLIIWICNRFDYHDGASLDCDFPDKEYYQLMNSAKNNPNVRIVGYTQFEMTYARSKGVDFGTQVLTPLPYFFQENVNSSIPSSVNKSETFFIPPYHNDTYFKVVENCKRQGLNVYQGRYNGPNDLKDFKGIVHIPYSWSNLAFFENLYAGLIYFVPSINFLIELANNNNFFIPNAHYFFNKKLWHESEWYSPKHAGLIMYFDSWPDLQVKINFAQQNQKEIKEKIKKFCDNEIKNICQQWKKIFTDLRIMS